MTSSELCGIIFARTYLPQNTNRPQRGVHNATDTTDRQIQIQYKIRKLRYKYKQADDRKHSDMLTHLIRSYEIVYGLDEFHLHAKAINARKAQKRRYNRKLADMVECYDQLYFVTLTYTDEVLESTNERTQHRYAQRWLNENCRDYLANEDFGKKNGRRHYHAVIAKKTTMEPWSYGYFNIKPINPSDGDRYRLSSYMLKLTNHAGKLGTGKHFSKRGYKSVDNLPF